MILLFYYIHHFIIVSKYVIYSRLIFYNRLVFVPGVQIIKINNFAISAYCIAFFVVFLKIVLRLISWLGEGMRRGLKNAGSLDSLLLKKKIHEGKKQAGRQVRTGHSKAR